MQRIKSIMNSLKQTERYDIVIPLKCCITINNEESKTTRVARVQIQHELSSAEKNISVINTSYFDLHIKSNSHCSRCSCLLKIGKLKLETTIGLK